MLYKIINDIDDLIYIGSTADKLCKRMANHRLSTKNKNSKIYIHMNLHGIENFKIILEIVQSWKPDLISSSTEWLGFESRARIYQK